MNKVKIKLSILQSVNGFRIDFAGFLLRSDRILGCQESIFPFNMVQNITISNRPFSVVLNMTDSNHFLVVWAIWMRPKHARYHTVRTDFALFRLGSHQLLGYQESTFPFSIVQNLAIPNRPLGVVLDMSNFEHFFFVSAEWMRPKHGWSFTAKMDFGSILMSPCWALPAFWVSQFWFSF